MDNQIASQEDFEQHFLNGNNSNKEHQKALKRSLYLNQILKNKDFIVEKLKQEHQLTVIWLYLTERQFITIPYKTFSRLVRLKVLQSDTIKKWRENSDLDNICNNKPSMKAQATKTNNAVKAPETKKSDNSQSKDKSKLLDIKAPSFDNWDGDSRKYIKEWIGE